ncbi:MAG: hypothetical protein WCP93_02435 [Candidatus Berkelbacteria bacterium]
MIDNNKKENRNIEPFVSQILERDICQDDVSIEEISSAKTPDYYLHENIFAEVKELHDGVDTSLSAQWSKVTNKLQTILSDKFISEKIEGLYSITTPRVYSLVGDDKFCLVATEIIKGIKENKNEILSHGINFDIKKINDKYNEVYLSTNWGGSINPAATIHNNIVKKLDTANKQLGYTYENHEVKRRVVLLVNKYMFADRISEVIEGLSYCYDDLLKYENIHEIWLQQETRDGRFVHTKIYDQKFIKEFEDCKIDPNSKDNQDQFELWYWALDKIDNKKENLFNALKKFLENNKPEDIFPDSYKREVMTRLGLWILEQNRIEDAVWLIDQFINDPNPGHPKDYIGDPKFNYHQEVEDGKDPSIITTVMGHLAWVVRELACKSERHKIDNLIKAFEYTHKVLTESDNFYTIEQWMIPLEEVANRRLLILEDNPDIYQRFRELVLDRKNGLIAKYNNFPAISKYLVQLFSYFKDLSTKDAKYVLDVLVDAPQSDSILVYFAIFRAQHYDLKADTGPSLMKIDPEIFSYDPQYAQDLLKKIILSEKPEQQELRASIAWQFWKILTDLPDTPDLLLWIDLLFTSPFNTRLYSSLDRILETCYSRDDIKKEWPLIKWFKLRISNTKKVVQDKIVDGKDIWLGVDGLIHFVAIDSTDELLPIMRDLEYLWMKGAYIGELEVFFNSYKKIADKVNQKNTKDYLQKMYLRMQKTNPKISIIDFE